MVFAVHYGIWSNVRRVVEPERPRNSRQDRGLLQTTTSTPNAGASCGGVVERDPVRRQNEVFAGCRRPDAAPTGAVGAR